ncbi:hypothetical protein F8M41_020796 [Gigaspora margarita]|uniref:Uncharacterized protein n=1 Tax=Gigaspora margarita TaxID=4874 RepID=A0A8H4EJK8_GIGMA|nr:hypothetical protein F8M41_020796 [Gigaspora margarita]
MDAYKKDQLLRTINQLRDQIINFQNTNDDLSTQLKELTQLNEVLKLVTAKSFDKEQLHKSQNFAAFEKQVDDIIFFEAFTDLKIDNIFLQNMINFVRMYQSFIKENKYTKKIYKIIVACIMMSYNFFMGYDSLRVIEYILANIFIFGWFYAYYSQKYPNQYLLLEI